MFKIALRSLGAHKIRLLLTAAAVFLGVAFVTGMLMLTNALDRTFTDIFESSAQDVLVTRTAAVAEDITQSTVTSALDPAIAKQFGLILAGFADFTRAAAGPLGVMQAGQVVEVTEAMGEALEAFQLCCSLEGIIPALEPSHAVAYAIKLAATMRPDQHLLVNLSGRGDKDIGTVADLSGAEFYCRPSCKGQGVKR